MVVPLYFSPFESVPIGRLELEVRFVSRGLKFSRLERGSAAVAADVDLSHEIEEVKDDQGLEQSTLRIVASVSEYARPQRGIPGGLIGYITFRVEEGAGPANITLRGTAQASELGTNKSVPNVEVVSEQVEIIAAGSEPLVSCFFFTH